MTENDILKSIGELSLHLNNTPDDVEKLLERAKLYMKIEKRNLALNDFNRIITLDNEHVEANSYILLITSIDDYFYNQTYNV